MILINRNSTPTPKVLSSPRVRTAFERLSEFYDLPEEKRGQNRGGQQLDGRIRAELLAPIQELFNDKCAYCESRLSKASSPGDIDHFRPKRGARGIDRNFDPDHYWWLNFVWENLYYACRQCNRYKSTWFPIEGDRAKIASTYTKVLETEKWLLIDPCNDDPEKHIQFSMDGMVQGVSIKGETTIDILKLNREGLIEEREAALKEVFGEWEEVIKFWNSDPERVDTIFKSWRQIISGDSSKPYLGARRYLINDRLSTNDSIAKDFRNNNGILKEAKHTLPREPTFEEWQKTSLEKPQEKPRDASQSSISSSVFLNRISFSNYKCFDSLIINFRVYEDNGGELRQPWLVFLGENGVGKSSILQAIALCLMGDDYRKRVEGFTPSRLLANGENEGFIKLFLVGTLEPIHISFKRGDEVVKVSGPKAKTYLLGYGSIRAMDSNRLTPENRSKGIVKALNLFDQGYPIANASKWLLNTNLTKVDFDRVSLALKDLLQLNMIQDEIKRSITKNELFVLRGEKKEFLDQLSDGYRTVLALAVDIIAMFSRDKIDYQLAEGIVLIDEIGNHLHPRWKMAIVDSLRRTFPLLQFIVTTHEPLCLRGLFEGEVVVLIKNSEQEVQAFTELPDPSIYRVDQLLTSPFFGLNSAIDPKTEKIFAEYYQILGKSETDRTEMEQSRLLELGTQIPRIKYLGDTLREELAVYVIDELIGESMNGQIEDLRIQNLKEETKKRVKRLWEELDNLEY